MASHQSQRHHHFLVVTISAQGQINPARRLARRLADTAGARVTIATPVSSRRLLVPSTSSAAADDIIDRDEGLVSYATYSDGFDEGFAPEDGDVSYFMTKLKLVGTQTLSLLSRSLGDRGRPVTCLIYTLLTDWAADVAADLGVPSHLFWVQPAAVFSIFYHYFHGYADAIVAHRNDPSFALNLPGLPPFEMKDLPSMLTAETPDPLLDIYRNVMNELQKEQGRIGGGKPRVLANTFHALEADAIEAVAGLNLVPIGALIEKDSAGKDLLEQDSSEYTQWLDAREPRSVVYVSFGSFAAFSTAQMEEIWEGLRESRRPYLWVIRRDIREKERELVGKFVEGDVGGNGGMVIEWCDQVRVLSHRSVGCFVTHCGWNSISESIVCGVPTVMLPKWLDQKANAKLVEAAWGAGVRAGLNGDGVMEGGELRRCLDLVMGEGEMGAGIRERVALWKQKAGEAAAADGPSVRSLLAFLAEL